MTDDLLANIEIAPRDVKQRLERGEEFLFVDVREPWEHQTSRIEGTKLVPLREIPAHVAELKEAKRSCCSATTGCAAWTLPRGSVRRASPARARCLAGLTAGP